MRIRSIDAVVDVTNYVLLELGQPMHAFDKDRIEGGIVVRMAKEGETLVLLDGTEAKLDADTRSSPTTTRRWRWAASLVANTLA
ncbi:hypothetical protein DMI65_21405 [Escherichia coli]|nr:hypothetical protein [Escherichia coli]